MRWINGLLDLTGTFVHIFLVLIGGWLSNGAGCIFSKYTIEFSRYTSMKTCNFTIRVHGCQEGDRIYMYD